MRLRRVKCSNTKLVAGEITRPGGTAFIRMRESMLASLRIAFGGFVNDLIISDYIISVSPQQYPWVPWAGYVPAVLCEARFAEGRHESIESSKKTPQGYGCRYRVPSREGWGLLSPHSGFDAAPTS